MTLQEIITELGEVRAEEILIQGVREQKLEAIKERALTEVDDEPLPEDLLRDWEFVFGNRQVDMQGWRARTLEGRIDVIQELIYHKLAFDKNVSRCCCGCNYILGCGTP